MFTEGNVDLAKLLLVRIYACASSNQLLVKDIFYILKGSGGHSSGSEGGQKKARYRITKNRHRADLGLA